MNYVGEHENDFTARGYVGQVAEDEGGEGVGVVREDVEVRALARRVRRTLDLRCWLERDSEVADWLPLTRVQEPYRDVARFFQKFMPDTLIWPKFIFYMQDFESYK